MVQNDGCIVIDYQQKHFRGIHLKKRKPVEKRNSQKQFLLISQHKVIQFYRYEIGLLK